MNSAMHIQDRDPFWNWNSARASHMSSILEMYDVIYYEKLGAH